MKDAMYQSHNQSHNQKSVYVFLFVSALFVGLSWAGIAWKMPYSSATYFLHYNIYFGIDLVGEWKQLFWIPGSGTAIVLLNMLLLFVFKQMDPFVRVLVASITAFLAAGVLLATILVILLNG